MDDADRSSRIEQQVRDACVRAAASPIRWVGAQRIIDGVKVCIGCSEPLSPDRLRVMPDAVRCVDCQAKRDSRC